MGQFPEESLPAMTEESLRNCLWAIKDQTHIASQLKAESCSSKSFFVLKKLVILKVGNFSGNIVPNSNTIQSEKYGCECLPIATAGPSPLLVWGH